MWYIPSKVFKTCQFSKMGETSLVRFGHFIKNQSVKILKIQNLENQQFDRRLAGQTDQLVGFLS
jgi:hypothetical protein